MRGRQVIPMKTWNWAGPLLARAAPANRSQMPSSLLRF
jgi:hypothetical protein